MCHFIFQENNRKVVFEVDDNEDNFELRQRNFSENDEQDVENQENREPLKLHRRYSAQHFHITLNE